MTIEHVVKLRPAITFCNTASEKKFDIRRSRSRDFLEIDTFFTGLIDSKCGEEWAPLFWETFSGSDKVENSTPAPAPAPQPCVASEKKWINIVLSLHHHWVTMVSRVIKIPEKVRKKRRSAAIVQFGRKNEIKLVDLFKNGTRRALIRTVILKLWI